MLCKNEEMLGKSIPNFGNLREPLLSNLESKSFSAQNKSKEKEKKKKICLYIYMYIYQLSFSS